MILVTAAGGNVGRRIVAQLVKKGLKVKAFDINPTVENLKAQGVAEIFVGDGLKPGVFQQAMQGCDKVLYIPPMFTFQETKIASMAVDAAVERGIEQFVMMSVTHPNMSTLLQHTAKLKAEEYLVYKGLSDGLNYTILQPMHYCHNMDVAQVMATGAYSIFYTPTTRLSYVDCEDVGEVAAKVLSEAGHNNATYELVNHDFLSPEDMVEIFNKVTGKKARAEYIPVEKVIEMFNITDSYTVETFIRLADTYGRYGIAGNPNVCEWLLGRKPTSFEEYVKREFSRL